MSYIIVLYASRAVKKCFNLHLLQSRALNATLKKVQKRASLIACSLGNEILFKFEMM